MAKKNSGTEHLPKCVQDYIRLFGRKMRYRKKIRGEVIDELVDHFTMALKDCADDSERETLAKELIEEFGDVKTLAKLSRRGKRRCRPMWHKIVEYSCHSLLLWLLCYGLYITFAQPNVSVDYIQKMNLMTKPNVDESLNAAPLYQKAFDSYIQLSHYPVLNFTHNKKWPDEFNSEEHDLLKKWISDNSQAIEYARQASMKPYCWYKRESPDASMMTMPVPGLNEIRHISIALLWKAKMEAANGQREQAFEDLLVCLRISQHYAGPRTLPEQMVGMAIKNWANDSAATIIENTDIDPEQLKRLQKKITELHKSTDYRINFKGEGFFDLDMIQRAYTDNGKGSGRLIPYYLMHSIRLINGGYGFKLRDNYFEKFVSPPASLFFAKMLNESSDFKLSNNYFGKFVSSPASLFFANRKDVTEKYISHYNVLEEIATLTPFQAKQQGLDNWGDREFKNAGKVERARFMFFYILTPRLDHIIDLFYSRQTDIEGFIAILGITRYEKETGQYPENLEALLEAGYIDGLPMDPFSDGALVYKRTDDGFLLYSVGLNFIDDNGTPGKTKAGTLKNYMNNGDTILWPLLKNRPKEEKAKQEIEAIAR